MYDFVRVIYGRHFFSCHPTYGVLLYSMINDYINDIAHAANENRHFLVACSLPPTIMAINSMSYFRLLWAETCFILYVYISP